MTQHILKIAPNSFFGHTGHVDRISINAENVDGILKWELSRSSQDVRLHVYHFTRMC